MSRRTERLASVIQQDLSAMIQRDLHDPRIPAITSITRVKVAEDLSVADVYVSLMGTEGEQSAGLNALRHSAGVMRTMLTKALSTRTTPFIKFHIDENLKKELAVLDLLRKVSEERAEREKERAAGDPSQGGEPEQQQQQGGDASAPPAE
jgi:ribosome-binding factor A